MTDTQTDGTDFIPSTADAGGNENTQALLHFQYLNLRCSAKEIIFYGGRVLRWAGNYAQREKMPTRKNTRILTFFGVLPSDGWIWDIGSSSEISRAHKRPSGNQDKLAALHNMNKPKDTSESTLSPWHGLNLLVSPSQKWGQMENTNNSLN